MEDTAVRHHALNVAARAPATTARDAGRPGLADRIARSLVFARLARMTEGELVLVEDHERTVFGRRTPAHPHPAIARVHSPRLWRSMATRGSIGAGEGYMQGLWSSDDLTGVVRAFVRNRDVLNSVEGGFARLSEPFHRLFHALRRNTPSGSRRNIQAHYDIGNDFYAEFLDETMMYSAAFFERPESSLLEASRAKNDRICRKLDLRPHDHLLEIGTGWGGFALHAAQEYGCRVTTTTISRRQHEFALERIRAAGLADRVEVLLCDYRDLSGTYDKLVSIEMIEAVGAEFYDAYFRRCGQLLAPGGRMCLQAITIADQEFDRARRSVDFIQRYIFPGSCIPSIAAITSSVARASDLRVTQLEDITAHYALTLAHWRSRFLANIERVRALDRSEEFLRMWDFYFAYCEGGFAERFIGSVQVVLSKPNDHTPIPFPGRA